jgi:hypothetical protein
MAHNGDAMYSLSGACHCGAIQVKLDLTRPTGETRVRACQCGFCRRHGTRTVADKDGLVAIRVASPAQLERYRFGHSSADYLICRTCGTYVAAIQDEAGRHISVVNVAGLDVEAFRGRAGEPVNYEGETAADRRARRRTYWMPAVLEIADQ